MVSFVEEIREVLNSNFQSEFPKERQFEVNESIQTTPYESDDIIIYKMKVKGGN